LSDRTEKIRKALESGKVVIIAFKPERFKVDKDRIEVIEA